MPAKIDRAAMREAIVKRYHELRKQRPNTNCFRQAVIETIPKGKIAKRFTILEWENELRQALQGAPVPRNGIWPTEFGGMGRGERRYEE